MKRSAKPTSVSTGWTSRDVGRSPEEIAAAIEAAPERVHDPECPYDPNDSAAVEAFWKKATVRRPGQQRGAEGMDGGSAE
jgi:hypothetical protein